MGLEDPFYSSKSLLIHGMFGGDRISKLFDSLCDWCISRKFHDWFGRLIESEQSWIRFWSLFDRHLRGVGEIVWRLDLGPPFLLDACRAQSCDLRLFEWFGMVARLEVAAFIGSALGQPVGKWISKTKVFVNFGLILRWAPHVCWVGTTLERVLLREEMKFVYSHMEIH